MDAFVPRSVEQEESSERRETWDMYVRGCWRRAVASYIEDRFRTEAEVLGCPFEDGDKEKKKGKD